MGDAVDTAWSKGGVTGGFRLPPSRAPRVQPANSAAHPPPHTGAVKPGEGPTDAIDLDAPAEGRPDDVQEIGSGGDVRGTNESRPAVKMALGRGIDMAIEKTLKNIDFKFSLKILFCILFTL